MKYLLLTFLVVATFAESHARSLVERQLSSRTPIVEHLDLGHESQSEGVVVRITFLEAENVVCVKLISYNPILGMWLDTPYSKAYRFSRLTPERLPAANVGSEGAKYRIDREAKRQVGKLSHRRRKYLMQQIIEIKDAIAEPYPLQLIDDEVEQRFSLAEDQTEFTLTLGDLAMVRRKESGKESYEIFSYSKLDTRYRVTIQRDYCLGREADIEAARSTLAAARTSLLSLRQIQQDPAMHNTDEKIELFDKLRAIALENLPKNTSEDRCPEVQSLIEQYNSTLDSLAAITIERRREEHVADYKLIRNQTRLMDKYMTILQYSHDRAERLEMAKLCKGIIDDVNIHIINTSIIDLQTKEAIEIFRSAEGVFINLMRGMK